MLPPLKDAIADINRVLSFAQRRGIVLATFDGDHHYTAAVQTYYDEREHRGRLKGDYEHAEQMDITLDRRMAPIIYDRLQFRTYFALPWYWKKDFPGDPDFLGRSTIQMFFSWIVTVTPWYFFVQTLEIPTGNLDDTEKTIHALDWDLIIPRDEILNKFTRYLTALASFQDFLRLSKRREYAAEILRWFVLSAPRDDEYGYICFDADKDTLDHADKFIKYLDTGVIEPWNNYD